MQTYIDPEQIASMENFMLAFDLDLGSKGTIVIMFVAAAILGLVAMALVLVSAIRIKKTRVFGIITAILQPVGLISAMLMLVCYDKIDFSQLFKVGSPSSESQMVSELMEYIMGPYLVGLIGITIFSMLVFVSMVATIVYSILLIKSKPKIFPILALVVCILRYMFVSPLDTVSMVMSVLTPEAASSNQSIIWTLVYLLISCVPALLLGIQGLMHKPEIVAAVEAKANKKKADKKKSK